MIDKVTFDRPARELGVGGEASVFEATFVHSNSWGDQVVKVAVKRLRSQKRDVRRAERLVDEVRLMADLQHPHVLRAHGVVLSPTTGPSAVLELCEGGSLAGAIKANALCGAEQGRIARELAAALAYLHRKPTAIEPKPIVIHADLKPGNILLTKELSVKVADFGMCNKHVRGAEGDCGVEVGGTRSFRSPEAWLRQELTTAADMYSYACVLTCMAKGTDRPYEREYDKDILLWHVPSGIIRPELPASHVWVDVLAGCRKCEPSERWSSERVVVYFERNDTF